MANTYTNSLYNMLEANEKIDKGKYTVKIPKFSSSHSNIFQKTLNEARSEHLTNDKNDLLDLNQDHDTESSPITDTKPHSEHYLDSYDTNERPVFLAAESKESLIGHLKEREKQLYVQASAVNRLVDNIGELEKSNQSSFLLSSHKIPLNRYGFSMHNIRAHQTVFLSPSDRGSSVVANRACPESPHALAIKTRRMNQELKLSTLYPKRPSTSLELSSSFQLNADASHSAQLLPSARP